MNSTLRNLGLIFSIAYTSISLIGAPEKKKDFFQKLIPIINTSAEKWCTKVTQLNSEAQLAYLNFFAASTQELIDILIKCSEYIDSLPELSKIHKELTEDIISLFKLYADDIQRKIAQNRNLSEKDQERIWQKFESKMLELMDQVNTIYYKTLYARVIKRGVSPMYMFDQNGLIPKEKRIKALPSI